MFFFKNAERAVCREYRHDMRYRERRPSDIGDMMNKIACFANQRNCPYRFYYFFLRPITKEKRERERIKLYILISQISTATIRKIIKIIELLLLI